ncbi:uL30 family ribosomal protein [Candidatus Woesearchaeota archaeon]|nr:uL30 family ribosomal protein [Candidatus Woesearchaeota archaeon]
METQKKNQSKSKAVEKAPSPSGATLAIVRVRGMVNNKPDVRRTLALLRLLKKNTCVVYPKTAAIAGMLKLAKDYITWGDLDDETHKLLVEKKGEGTLFHLHPPRGGFGRKGIKRSFAAHGALGDRGVKINDLVKRMLP